MTHDSDDATYDMQQCIQNCRDCHRICMLTLTHWLGKGSDQGPHVRLLLDCAEICQVSANFMLRSSDQHVYTCAVCAQVCERCARECERLGAGDEEMRLCGEMCQRCADSCHYMASATV